MVVLRALWRGARRVVLVCCATCLAAAGPASAEVPIPDPCALAPASVVTTDFGFAVPHPKDTRLGTTGPFQMRECYYETKPTSITVNIGTLSFAASFVRGKGSVDYSRPAGLGSQGQVWLTPPPYAAWVTKMVKGQFFGEVTTFDDSKTAATVSERPVLALARYLYAHMPA
jgi:hypothetical protein